MKPVSMMTKSEYISYLEELYLTQYHILKQIHLDLSSTETILIIFMIISVMSFGFNIYLLL